MVLKFIEYIAKIVLLLRLCVVCRAHLLIVLVLGDNIQFLLGFEVRFYFLSRIGVRRFLIDLPNLSLYVTVGKVVFILECCDALHQLVDGTRLSQYPFLFDWTLHLGIHVLTTQYWLRLNQRLFFGSNCRHRRLFRLTLFKFLLLCRFLIIDLFLLQVFLILITMNATDLHVDRVWIIVLAKAFNQFLLWLLLLYQVLSDH